MEISTKNTLIKTSIPSAVTLIIGVVGIFVGNDIAHSIINNNVNQNVNSNTLTVNFDNGTSHTYSEDDIKNLEENNQELKQANQQLLSSGYRYKKYENIELLLNNIQINSNNNYSICIIDGVNYYSENILKEINDIDILFDNNENMLYINENEEYILQ